MSGHSNLKLRTKKCQIWAVVPAAGAGTRMKASLPKQYLPLAGSTVIANTLARLAAQPRLSGIVVATAADDERWLSEQPSLQIPVYRVTGDATRSDSVLAGLRYLEQSALVAPDAWVLVHDAARPCVRPSDLEFLISEIERRQADGGLLALPLTDTVKRATAENLVKETVSRDMLWRALTPQLFPLSALSCALADAINKGRTPTDEAVAMEWAGFYPLLVEGHADNIKITHPEDLALAELILKSQREEV